LHLFFKFWKRSFASLIAQRRANSRMMSNHILTVIGKYLDSRRAKCYQSSHQEAQNSKMRCGLRERIPFGRTFRPYKHPKVPKMFVKFAPTSLKIAQNTPKSSQSPHQKPPKLSCFMENVDFVDKMFPLFALRRNKC